MNTTQRKKKNSHKTTARGCVKERESQMHSLEATTPYRFWHAQVKRSLRETSTTAGGSEGVMRDTKEGKTKRQKSCMVVSHCCFNQIWDKRARAKS